jgi:PAS domain S-box-containing protein
MTDSVVKSMLQRLGIASSLDVPIIIEGKYWGRICFDECTTEREWTSSEVDILRTAADMIGSAMIRERYVKQLRDANTIIERSPTILFRLRGEPSVPLIYVSHNVTVFGCDPAEMIASPQLYKTIIHPDDELKILEMLARIVMEGTPSETVEFRMRTREGIYRWVENHYTPIRDAAGRLVEIEGILTDVTEKKEAAEWSSPRPMRSQGSPTVRPSSIGCANPSPAKRGANPFAVLYLDLDRFKDVNDTVGHFAGDLLLKAVAERLNGCTRETDLVGRLGGDEFAILQTELIDVSNAGVLASKVHDVLAAPYPLGNTEMHISASIGISPYMYETKGAD